MSASALYAGARAKAWEARSLTPEVAARLLDCKREDETVKIMAELGYEGSGAEAMLKNETEKLYSFLIECSPDDEITACFLKKNDYHNAKALAKAKYSGGADCSFILIGHAAIEPKELKDYVFGDNYTFLPLPMKGALEAIDAEFARGERSPQFIDAELNKAMYSDITTLLEGKKREIAGRYFIAEIDLGNISAARRMANFGLKAEVRRQYVPGGLISENDILRLAECRDEAVSEILAFTPYSGLAKYLQQAAFTGGALIAFERARDEYLLSLFKEVKYDIESADYFYGFIIKKLTEIKNLRLLSALAAGADKAEVKERLRDIYV